MMMPAKYAGDSLAPMLSGADDRCRDLAAIWPVLAVGPGSRLGLAAQAGEYCYLVMQGLVATYVLLDQQRATCIGLAGPGELVGIESLTPAVADGTLQSRAVVAAQMHRVPSQQIEEALARSPAVRSACLRQFQKELVAARHFAACNARHLLPERCAHWLLQLRVRLGDYLPVTHEFLASVLGVRRAGVTVTLQELQRSGAIRQQRGSIAITSVERLQEAACHCPVAQQHPIWSPQTWTELQGNMISA